MHIFHFSTQRKAKTFGRPGTKKTSEPEPAPPAKKSISAKNKNFRFSDAKIATRRYKQPAHHLTSCFDTTHTPHTDA